MGIEVIDLAGSFDDDHRARRTIAGEIGRACESGSS